MQFNTLTLTLQNFIAVFSTGYSRIQGPVHSLLAIFVGIEVVLLGLWTALSGGDNLVGIFKKILHIGGWVWVVQSFPSLTKAFVESLVQAGLMAGGGGSVSLLMDPSRLAGYGLDAATAPLDAEARRPWDDRPFGSLLRLRIRLSRDSRLFFHHGH